MGDIALRGNKLTATKGGRVGLKHGGKPWGTGPKPGTHEFLQQHLHKPRKRKVGGGLIKNIPKLLKKLGTEIKAQPLPPQLQKTLDEVKKLQDLQKTPRVKKAAGGRIGLRTGSRGPKHHKPKPPRLPRFPDKWKPRQWPRRPEKSFIEQAGGSEKAKPHSTKEGRIASGTRRIKRLLAGDKGRPKAGPQAPSSPWRRLPPKYSPGPRDPREPKKYSPGPRDPREPKKYQPAAEGGRIGFKKGTDKKWMQKVSASIKKRGTKGKCTPITKPGCTGRAKALAKTFKKIAAKRKA